MPRARPPWPEHDELFLPSEVRWAVHSALARLRKRDGRIVAARYGVSLDSIGCDIGPAWWVATPGRPMSLNSIAAIVGLTPQRVHQIIVDRLRDLRWILEEDVTVSAWRRSRARRFTSLGDTPRGGGS
jgi:DNA-directed RNA polymerase sigma subunit (sigma70/sigma32)